MEKLKGVFIRSKSSYNNKNFQLFHNFATALLYFQHFYNFATILLYDTPEGGNHEFTWTRYFIFTSSNLSHSKIILPLSHFVCPLFYFGMYQNIVMFLKIRVINLLIFLLYSYYLIFLLII